MQHQSLVVTNFLDYASRWHGEQVRTPTVPLHISETPWSSLMHLFRRSSLPRPRTVLHCERPMSRTVPSPSASQEVVTQTVEGGIHRSNYAQLHARSQQCALALQKLGVQCVPTLRMPDIALSCYNAARPKTGSVKCVARAYLLLASPSVGAPLFCAYCWLPIAGLVTLWRRWHGTHSGTWRCVG